jgi:hypothetical protein
MKNIFLIFAFALINFVVPFSALAQCPDGSIRMTLPNGSQITHEHAIACYARSVFEKLEISLSPPAAPADDAEAVPRSGYDPDFLGQGARVAAPTLTAAGSGKAFKRNGSEVIPNTHFSLAQNEKRRFAIVLAFVAAAILTPPDPISQIGLAIPIMVLYEISIWSVLLVERGRKDDDAADDVDDDDDESDGKNGTGGAGKGKDLVGTA